MRFPGTRVLSQFAENCAASRNHRWRGAFEERREEFLTCSRVRCDGLLREQRRKVKKGRQRGESVRRPSPEIRKVNGGQSGIYEVIPAQQNGNTKALSCPFVSHAVFHCGVFRVLL